MPDRQVRAIAANLLEAMRFFGYARAGGEIQEHPGVCLIGCGLNYAAFNAAVLSEPVGSASGELSRRIQIPALHFESRRLRWTYWLCDDFLEGPARKESRAIFSRFGLSPLTDSPGMYAGQVHPPKRNLPPIQVRKVEDEATRNAFSHITSVAFEIPYGICREIYGTERAWTGSFKGFVGYSGGLPVSTTATVIAGDVVGIYSVGTLPNCRRHGFAEATMRAALNEARERTGIEATVLQATVSGYSLYERMGYRKLTKFSVYIS